MRCHVSLDDIASTRCTQNSSVHSSGTGLHTEAKALCFREGLGVGRSHILEESRLDGSDTRKP